MWFLILVLKTTAPLLLFVDIFVQVKIFFLVTKKRSLPDLSCDHHFCTSASIFCWYKTTNFCIGEDLFFLIIKQKMVSYFSLTSHVACCDHHLYYCFFLDWRQTICVQDWSPIFCFPSVARPHIYSLYFFLWYNCSRWML